MTTKTTATATDAIDANIVIFIPRNKPFDEVAGFWLLDCSKISPFELTFSYKTSSSHTSIFNVAIYLVHRSLPRETDISTF